mmetsp:Transcript_135771/g.434353  ORF Transcript_135771/g.434353 Transcript_135771/m.434353 type:complete len:171 (-) Transcript_135771:122-634(-)
MFEWLKEKAGIGVEATTGAVQERMDTAKGGKQMVDEGGQPARAALLAKGDAKDAVGTDKEANRLISLGAERLETAAKKLREAAGMPDVEGIEGKEKFASLADSFEERATAYTKAVSLLTGEMEGPAFSDVETDALRLVLAQEGYEWAYEKGASAAGAAAKSCGYKDTSAV